MSVIMPAVWIVDRRKVAGLGRFLEPHRCWSLAVLE